MSTLDPAIIVREEEPRDLPSIRLVECAAHRHVIVLGHPRYYPIFGFAPARPLGVSCDYNVPDDTFMILALGDASLDEVRGTARYHPEFNGL